VPKPQYAGPWRRVRALVLERDGHRCQIKGGKCLGLATEVDHINPVELGGSWWDVDNLRAACKPCNVGRVSAQRLEAWRQGPPITLVYGPPGAGKTTYVAQHSQPGDLVVDYDAIAQALGADRQQSEQIHEAVMAARNAVLSRIRQNRTGAPAVWIVSANPRAAEMFPHHEAVYLHPGADVARAQAVGRTAGALASIDAWPGRSDVWS
jgi:hypothetical protein